MPFYTIQTLVLLKIKVFLTIQSSIISFDFNTYQFMYENSFSINNLLKTSVGHQIDVLLKVCRKLVNHLFSSNVAILVQHLKVSLKR